MVQEYERAVIFRLGRLLKGGARGPGIFFIVPCIDTYRKIDLRTVSFDVPPQEVSTRFRSFVFFFLFFLIFGILKNALHRSFLSSFATPSRFSSRLKFGDERLYFIYYFLNNHRCWGFSDYLGVNNHGRLGVKRI